jgi:hypothetical protein
MGTPFLSRCQKLDQVRLSQQLFLMLERQGRRSWHDIVTLDGSWFHLHTDYELFWTQPDAEIPERERHTVQSQKVMPAIVWNPGGFHLANILSKGFRFNTSYDVTQVLDPLSKWRRTQVGRTNRKLIMHADNARHHIAKITSQFMEENSMQKAPHPAHSPDLAPSDFYLFGYVKQLLSECQFTDQESLLQAVSDILMGIKKSPWKASFTTGWRDCANVVKPVGSTWNKETFYINRITDNTVDPEMFMGRWDTLYMKNNRVQVLQHPDVIITFSYSNKTINHQDISASPVALLV